MARRVDLVIPTNNNESHTSPTSQSTLGNIICGRDKCADTRQSTNYKQFTMFHIFYQTLKTKLHES